MLILVHDEVGLVVVDQQQIRDSNCELYRTKLDQPTLLSFRPSRRLASMVAPETPLLGEEMSRVTGQVAFNIFPRH